MSNMDCLFENGILAQYRPDKKKIWLIEESSNLKMSVPFKKCEHAGEFQDYAYGMIDMLLRMGGK